MVNVHGAVAQWEPGSNGTRASRKRSQRSSSTAAPASGGDFYHNQNTRIGELFATEVLRAAMEGRIGFKEAYDLTGLRGGTFQKYAGRLGVNLP